MDKQVKGIIEDLQWMIDEAIDATNKRIEHERVK